MVVARKQVQAGAVAGAAADPNANIASQAKGLQDKARSDVTRALQDGAQRNDNAER
jgi:hypothetical protein